MTADPSIGVAPRALRGGGLQLGESRLCSHQGVSWKSAVPVEWLARHHRLFGEYFGVAKNSLLPGKKHKDAVERIDNNTKEDAGRWS